MNIFIREMKAHRKSLILWMIGILFTIIGGMSKYTYYVDSGESIKELIATIPESLRTILGFGNFDVTKASGFYGILFLYLVVMVTIHASMLGANIIAKEERDKTTEFLMVKPVSRARVVTSKLLAAFVNVLLINIATLLMSITIVGKYSGGEDITEDILILMVGMLFLQVMFLLIGTAIAAVSRNPKISASIATNFLLVSYILSILVDMNGNLGGLKYITLFKYFDAQHMMYGGGLEPVFVMLSMIIIVGLLAVTYTFYKKRDLNV